MRHDHHPEDEEDAPTVRMPGDQTRRWLEELTTPVTPAPRVARPVETLDEGSLEEVSVPQPADAQVVPTHRTERAWIAGAAMLLAGLTAAGAWLLYAGKA